MGLGNTSALESFFMLAYMGKFGAGSLERKLGVAYSKFQTWCEQNGRNTSIDSFDFKTFKVTKPDSQLIAFKFQRVRAGKPLGLALLRTVIYPKGLGKGHDCAAVAGWLEFFVDGSSPPDAPWPQLMLVFCFRHCAS